MKVMRQPDIMLNNAIKMLDYIKINCDCEQQFIINDIDFAKLLNVSKSTIILWRNKLVENKYIYCHAQFVSCRKQMVYKIRNEEY